MPINVECANGHKLRVNERLAGKKVRCPKCQSIVLVEPAGREQVAEEFSDWPDEPNEIQLPPSPQRRPQRKTGNRRAAPSRRGPWVALGIAGVAAVLVGVAVFVFRRPGASSTANKAEPVAAQPTVAAEGQAPSADQPRPESDGKPPDPKKNPSPLANEPVQNTLVASAVPAALPNLKAVTKAAPIVLSSKQPQPTSLKSGVVVWDTVEPGRVEVSQSRAGGSAGWEPVTSQAGSAYRFRGDCVIENEKVRLRLFHDTPQAIFTAKSGLGERAAVPIALFGKASKSSVSRSIRVAGLSDGSATIVYGPEGRGPKVACRLEANKSWVEFQPQDGAAQLVVGLKSRFVVAPSEFGEDLICDALLYQAGQSVRVSAAPLAIALEENGSFLTALAYSSTDQAGSLTVSGGAGTESGETADSLRLSSISANFNGKSVYLALLPQSNLWHCEAVDKKYSASGQYTIRWKPTYPGVWRLAGRVNGKYFVSDVPDDRFIFACSLSGSLDYVVAYLSTPPEGHSSEVATPMTVYRETVGRTSATAPLIESEGDDGRSLMRQKTRYRDVCNSVDDMKDRWRTRPDTLQSDREYVPNLLEDCRAIVQRMDRRLEEYRDLSKRVGQIAAEMKEKKVGEDASSSRAFPALLQSSQAKLKSLSAVPATRALAAIDTIKQKVTQPRGGRTKATELDRIAEGMRDVANNQEVHLKKLRAAALQLADACSKQRKSAPSAVAPYMTSVGRHCRKVLRNRDPEE